MPEQVATDRISQMSREELEAATRELVDAAMVINGGFERHGLTLNLKAFQPTTLDKVRELLKADGFLPITGGRVARPTVILYDRPVEEVWVKT